MMPPLALDFTRPPHAFLLEPIVRHALDEDLGRAGDLTATLVVPRDQQTRGRLVARQSGTVSGLIAAQCAFRLLESAVQFTPHIPDGATAEPGAILATVAGSAQGLLGAERVALNFLGHLSGIATSTCAFVEAVTGTRASIVCTRKTTPGLRFLEKYAVRCGGGFNHRFGLDDAVLIKDNHIAAAGDIATAVRRARAGVGHMVRIEVEVDTLAQFEQALTLGVDAILLDNMDLDELSHAVALTNGKAVLEASGGVSLSNVRAIAQTGVDCISIGAITHSAPSLDVALDF